MFDLPAIRAAAKALVAANDDLRGTQSASAPPELMNLIDAVDEDVDSAIVYWSWATAIGAYMESNLDWGEWREMMESDPELLALTKALNL